MDDTNKTCRAFLNDLSSASPTPGGGGAAAGRSPAHRPRRGR